MKKLILITYLIMTPIMAQENHKTITVTGEANKSIKTANYLMTVSIKEIIPDGYQQIEAKSVDEVKNEYADKLRVINVDFNKFKKNNVYKIQSSGYEVGDIDYYNFESSSQDEMLNILHEKVKGISVLHVEVLSKEKTNKELSDLTLEAIADAKIKANEIAKGIGTKIIEIVNIVSANHKTGYINANNPDGIEKHYVTVTFNVE